MDGKGDQEAQDSGPVQDKEKTGAKCWDKFRFVIAY